MSTNASTGRARIIAESRTLIAQNGFGALTYDALAKATGMTKGGILYHFPTKDALVRGVFEDVLEARPICSQIFCTRKPFENFGQRFRISKNRK